MPPKTPPTIREPHPLTFELLDALREQQHEWSGKGFPSPSLVGRECDRQLWYMANGVPPSDEIDPASILAMLQGSSQEPLVEDLLRRTGRKVESQVTLTPDQCAAIGVAEGTADGADKDSIYEYKRTGMWRYLNIVRQGLQTADPTYFAQVQLYMAALGRKNTLFIMVSADYCLAPDTRVLKADLTWEPIGDIKQGDLLVAFDEDSPRSWRTTPVLATTWVRQPSSKLYLEDNTVVTASNQHRWLVGAPDGHGGFRQWLPTDRLVVGKNRHSHIARLTNTWSHDRSWEAGYLAGVLDGEGWLGQHNRIGIAQNQNACLDQTMGVVEHLDVPISLYAKGDKLVGVNLTGGFAQSMETLGRVRPARLLQRFSAENAGRMAVRSWPRVMEREPVGEQNLVGIQTGTGTFVAEGLASHNSAVRWYWKFQYKTLEGIPPAVWVEEIPLEPAAVAALTQRTDELRSLVNIDEAKSVPRIADPAKLPETAWPCGWCRFRNLCITAG